MRRFISALLLIVALLSLAPATAHAGAYCSTVSMPAGSFCDAIAKEAVRRSLERLTTARTYYFRNDGNDNCDGLTNGAGSSGSCAFLTPQKAIDTISSTLDIGDHLVTVQAGECAAAPGTPTTYAATIIGKTVKRAGGVVVVQGNTSTPTNCTLAGVSHGMQSAVVDGLYHIQGFKITAAAGYAINASEGSHIKFQNIDFGSATSGHLGGTRGGQVVALGNYTISAGAPAHYFSEDGGLVLVIGRTVTLSGTPNFSIAFAVSTKNGQLEVAANTYTGPATGTRYSVSQLAFINTNNAGATYLPGNAPGVIASGGYYDTIGVALPNYVTGLTLSASGGTATFGIAPGTATNSTNAVMMTLGAAYTKTTSAWAVGSGNGALDTGSIANNTWYHIYLIERLDTLVTDILISTSASAPTLPANYTVFRRIGSMRTDGAAQWIAFTQVGDDFLWKAVIEDVAVATLGTTRTSYTLSTPLGVQTVALLNAGVQHGASGVAVLVSALEQNDQTPSIAAMFTFIAGATIYATGQLTVRTNTSSQIGARSDQTNTNIYLITRGWTDYRGKS